MLGCTYLSTGADSTYGTDSSLGTNSSYGIGSTVELIPCDSNSISVVYGSNSGSGSRKNGILTSLAHTVSAKREKRNKYHCSRRNADSFENSLKIQ